VLARLEPVDASGTRDVEQHTPSDEAILENLDRVRIGASRGDNRVGLPAEEVAFVRDWEKASIWLWPSLW
jgi:hypothetical protein